MQHLPQTVEAVFRKLPVKIDLVNAPYALFRARMATLKFIDESDSASTLAVLLCYVNTFQMEMYCMQPGDAFPHKRQYLSWNY